MFLHFFIRAKIYYFFVKYYQYALKILEDLRYLSNFQKFIKYQIYHSY